LSTTSSTASAWQARSAAAARAAKAGDHVAALEHRREAKLLRLAEQVGREVADYPPLTVEQRRRLAAAVARGGDAA
jgi:hypothetical protein